MAGTTYNTLNLGVEHVRPKVDSTKKVGAVAAVVVAVCVMFFAGRVYQGNTTPFTHEEVMNVAETCEIGDFIGKCVDCRECASYEYANGGCTFFKDTFCSYCEPIPNCVRENIVCTSRTDSKCGVCTCEDKIDQWTDVSKEEYDLIGHLSDATSHSCYLGPACLPCYVCQRGFYQTPYDDETGTSGACDPANNKDTECNRCTVCQENEYVESACTYHSDTVCKPCTDCNVAEGGQETRDIHAADDGHCTGLASHNINDVFTNGHDTLCKDCTTCKGDGQEYVSTQCTANEDSTCDACEVCEDGQFVLSPCEQSHEIFRRETANLVCQDCKELETPRDSYVTTLCIKDLESDFQLLPCTKCQPGEWTKTACEIGSESSLGIDTDCDDCTHIAGCKAGSVRCTDDQDQLCSGCADNDDTKAQFDTWGHCCEDGFMGDRCGWKIVETGCDAAGNSFKERTARSGGWINSRDEKTNANFVNWCRKFCDSEDECTAYEVEDCLFGDEYCVVDDTKCKLKFHAEYLFDGEAGQTCVTRPPPV